MSTETIKDGGPAFPEKRATKAMITGPHGQMEPIFEIAGGMSLRDWFAGQALTGLMADSNFDALAERVASLSYDLADAMLKARESSNA